MWYLFNNENGLEALASTKKAICDFHYSMLWVKVKRRCKGLYDVYRQDMDTGRYEYNEPYLLINSDSREAVEKEDFTKFLVNINENSSISYPALLWQPPASMQFGIYHYCSTVCEDALDKPLFRIKSDLNSDCPPIKTFRTEKETVEALKQYPSTLTPIGDGKFKADVYVAAYNMIKEKLAVEYIDGFRDYSISGEENKLDFAEIMTNLKNSVSMNDLKIYDSYIFSLPCYETTLIRTQYGYLKSGLGATIEDLYQKLKAK